MRRILVVFAMFLSLAAGIRAQESTRWERLLGIPAGHPAARPLPPPEGFQDHVVNGQLVLSLDDAIRLAFENNTDIRVDESSLRNAENNIHRSFQFFDPLFFSSFSDQRVKSPSSTQLAGAPVLNTLSQNTQFGYSQNFSPGTNFQTSFNASKFSTNSSFSFLNPSFSTFWQFQAAQPLLRNFGRFPNRAPILIAQRNLRQSRSSFHAQVSNILLQVITQYWNAVLARDNLVVQKKAYEEAQQSYDHDKKALSLGALPPLDIYRSESQVASRRLSVIQAEYALKQAEENFRQIIGANRSPDIGALDLNLTEDAAPHAAMITTDIAAALSTAFANRPEVDADQQQLAADEISVRLAHNNLRPDLRLSGLYSTNGLGGNQFSTATPPVLIAPGGLGDSLNQLFNFNFPTYGATLTLSLPIKNHGAEADLADALVDRNRDQYRQERTRQVITLEVTNAVHQVEESKLSVEAAKVAVDLAEKTLQAEQRKYTLGNSTVFFVLDAQTQLAQAEFSQVQAQTGYQSAVAALDFATGELLEHHQIQIAPAHK